jgi:D-alanyl-D-alanine carboxypeptidase/D-alanyl-D-alanine-endopeptidase (penicillin-binding protein 4)
MKRSAPPRLSPLLLLSVFASTLTSTPFALFMPPWTLAPAVGLPAVGAAEPSPEPRDGRFAAVVDSPRYRTAHWGLLFVDAATGEAIYSLNADKLFVPASVTKCFSVAAALDALGADHRFETPVRVRGTQDPDGTLRGDLILVASGDPTMGGRTLPDGTIAFHDNDHTYANGARETRLTAVDPLAGLEELARQIAAAGIRRVAGDLLIDDRLFDKAEGSGSGPGRITPIQINDNLIDFTITPDAAGKPAKVEWRPRSAALSVETRFQTVEKGGALVTWIRDLGQGRLYVHGQIPADHPPVVRVHEVADAASHARSLLMEALERRGVHFDAAKLADNRPEALPPSDQVAGLPKVASLVSPPFAENARLILKVSHNLHAGTLPLLVATKHGQRTLVDGLRRQGEFLARAGLDTAQLSFAGGAGGARADHVTPRGTVQLLRHMRGRPDFPVYRRAMPVLGVDGTLASSVAAESPARGQVQAKTGTLSWDNLLGGGSLLTSKSLAGYLTTKSGREVVFAAFVNNVPLRDGLDSRAVGRDLGRLCELMLEATP